MTFLNSHAALRIYERMESSYPNVWRLADEVRATFSKNAHREGSIFSVSEASMVVNKLAKKHDEFIDPLLVGALVAWRPSKSIFKFKDAMFEALIETDLKGNIPSDILLRMPSWAVYIETQPSENMPYPIEGFWAYLSRLGNQNELILVAHLRKGKEAEDLGFDCDKDVLSFQLPLGNHPVDELVRMMFADSSRPLNDDILTILSAVVSNMLTLVLYLCSEEPDIDNFKAPVATIKYFGKNPRIISAKEPVKWEVGVRLGAALDLARARQADIINGNVSGILIEPHIRRAHWHSFWVGKKGQQQITIKWLPPIPVNAEIENNLPAVVREVSSGNCSALDKDDHKN